MKSLTIITDKICRIFTRIQARILVLDIVVKQHRKNAAAIFIQCTVIFGLQITVFLPDFKNVFELGHGIDLIAILEYFFRVF